MRVPRECSALSLWICASVLLMLSATAVYAGESGSQRLAGSEWMPDLHWRLVGPFRGGRTRAVAGVPGDPTVFYMGQVDGGVWKSTDYGRTWHPIFDDAPTQSIGAIAVAPSDSKIIYVASGEGLHRPDLSVGDGIYRSQDSGKTWQHLGLRDGQQIPSLAVDPRNPKRVFAAVLGHPYGANEERGIFRSDDGGETWKKIFYKGPDTGGSEVALDPNHPDTVYAALWQSRLGPWEDGNEYAGTKGGLFKSMDGGDTWQPLKKGLPEDLVQIQVAVAPSQSNRLYATVSTTHEGGYATGVGLGVYRSDDSGESWYKATDDPRPAMKIGGGDLPVPAVDPMNPDVVYSASIVTMRSMDGGKTWTGLRGAPGGDDYQNIWINPKDSNVILLVGDQGALVSVNRGESWSSWYNQPTAQLYHVAVTNTFPYQICAGQQESGSVCISSRGNDGEITFRDWHPVGIIEYGYAAPDPLHPEIVYGAGRTEVSRYDRITGQVQNITPVPMHDKNVRADRTEPLLFSPVDPHLLFYAANVLFETSDYGKSWRTISPDLSREHTGQPDSLDPLPAKQAQMRRGAIYSVAASYQSVNTIWAGTDDGLLWITRDHGKTWKNITPPTLTPWSKVTQISASHFDDNTAYVSVSRFRIDDLRPYIFRTQDGGATWKLITEGLPGNSPVNTIREDPVRKGLLFAGTETAVWVSVDDGDHWHSLQYNLPHTSMRDLWIQGSDLIVATHGRSFWILDDISPLRQQDGLNTQDGLALFAPADAYRIRRDTNTDTPLPIDEPAGENPPDGAVIDYRLPSTTSGPVTLEIQDEKGTVIRHYSSADLPEPTPEASAKQLIPLYWLRSPQALPNTPGMHRWVWDLRCETPIATNYEYPIAAVPHDTPRTPQGPLVLPGTYRVRLEANGKTLWSTLHVKMDPRVDNPLADLEALFATESRLASMVTKSAEADMQAHSVHEQIESIAQKAPQEVKELLEKCDKRVTALTSGESDSAKKEDAKGLDDVTGEVASLYAQVGQADAAPTDAQRSAVEQVSREEDEALRAWTQLTTTTIPDLNRRLSTMRLPIIDLQQRPTSMPQSGDED